MPLLGYTCPEVLELISDSANLKDRKNSSQSIETPVISDNRGSYTLLEPRVLKNVLLSKDGRSVNLNHLPHILLVPDLNTGNIVAKLDFFIKDIVRVSCSYTSMGPVLLPSRADIAKSIIREFIFGVALVALRRNLVDD